MADREGRLRDKPKEIKLQVLPSDNCDIETLLESLSDHFITRYEVDGERYIQVNNFSKHQNPHKNENSSAIPEYSENNTSTPEITRVAPEQHQSNRADSSYSDSSYSDSLSIEDTNVSSLAQNCAEEPEKVSESLAVQTAAGAGDEPVDHSKTSPSKRFDAFWAAYPKKKNKGDAEKAFKAIKPDDLLLDSMLHALESARKSKDWAKDGGQYIPYPATWLRAKAWEDENDIEVQARPDEPTQKSFSQIIAERTGKHDT